MSEIISVYKSHPPCFVSAPLPMFSPSANSPTIHFCKHICAVWNHFLEAVKAIPISVLIANKPLNDNSNIVKIIDTSPDPSNQDLDFVDDMGTKLQELANQFCLHPPTILSETLHDLNMQLSNVLSYF